MKLAISVILALVCTLAVADQKDVLGKVCEGSMTSAASYWDGTKCSPCPTGCLECVWKNNAVSCISCEKGKGKFLKIDNGVGSCADCSANCPDCKGPGADNCITTADSYKVAPEGVFKCSQTGCLYCNPDDKCTKCQYGYRMDTAAGKCVACNAGPCADCTDSVTTCKKCQYNSVLKNNTCVACSTGCTGCPCTACLPTYAFKDGACVSCTAANCATCPAADTTQCTACNAGYGFNKGDTKAGCVACGAGCTSCSANSEECTACSPGFALKDKACVQCPKDCAVCDGTGTCTTCKKLFYPSPDKSCTACPTSCADCGSDGLCTACPAGTILSTDKKECTKCGDNCDVCKDATTCATCQAASLPNGKGGCVSLLTCKLGQSLDGNAACWNGTIDNCAYGNNVTASCVICAVGYYVNGKVCTPCPTGCEKCSTPKGVLQCDKVAQDYFSKVTANGKDDIVGYAPGNVATTKNNMPATCMPNNLLTSPILNMTNTQCNAYDNCPYPVSLGAGNWACYMDGKGNNAVKVTVSLFAMVVVAILAL